MLKYTRALVSKHVLDFERRNGIMPGLTRKSARARGVYARIHGADKVTEQARLASALRLCDSRNREDLRAAPG